MKQHKAPSKARPKAPSKANNGASPKPYPGRDQARPQPRTAGKAPQKTAPQRFGQGELLYGTHAVGAALTNPDRQHRELWLADTRDADDLKIPKSVKTTIVPRADLDRMLYSKGANIVHQGIVLITSPLPDLILDEVLDNHEGKTGPLVLLDQVTDPHNIGAILRSAAVFGARALITTDRHAPADTAVLAKAASGALELVPIVRVVNLSRALTQIGEAGYTRLGLAEGGSRTIGEAAKGHDKVALVMGAEGPGLRRLTRENCDELVNLPAAGSFTTLNVSNAAAVALYAVTCG